MNDDSRHSIRRSPQRYYTYERFQNTGYQTIAGLGLDPWDDPYDLVLSSSPDGNKFLDCIRALGNSLGHLFYNEQIKGKTIIALKADLHSNAALLFARGNGKEFHIVARTINLMGAPGSRNRAYQDEISEALSKAHCTNPHLWIGTEDGVTSPQIPTAHLRTRRRSY